MEAASDLGTRLVPKEPLPLAPPQRMLGILKARISGRLVRGLSADALRVRLMERLGIQKTPSRKPWTRPVKGANR